MFGRIREASKSAFQRMGNLHSSDNVDPDIQLYDTLTGQDFSMIMNKYGEEETMRYIREMERKRLQGR
jgi:hypothetical protein